MGKLRFGVVVVAIVCLPGLVAAQGFLPSFQGFDSFDLGSVQVSPSVKIGYQSVGLNLNVPVPFSGIFGLELATQSTLDFKLLDGGMWIGGLGVNARRDMFRAFLCVEANAPKNVRVAMSSDAFWAGFFRVDWSGSRLEWWSIDGGGGVDLSSNYGIVAGLRLEHLALKLADAVDPNGLIQEYQAVYGDRYRSDLQSKVWLPYVGIRTSGSYFQGLFRFSPVVFCDAKIPLRYTYIAMPLVGFEEAKYTFKRIGLWVDASLDSAVQVTPNVRFSVWFKGSWLKVRGTGSEGYQYDAIFANVVFDNVEEESGSATGMYTSYVVAGGLRAEAAF